MGKSLFARHYELWVVGLLLDAASLGIVAPHWTRLALVLSTTLETKKSHPHRTVGSTINEHGMLPSLQKGLLTH